MNASTIRCTLKNDFYEIFIDGNLNDINQEEIFFEDEIILVNKENLTAYMNFNKSKNINNKNIKFHKIASYLGYQKTFLCRNKKDIIKFLNFSIKNKKSTFLEILSSPGYEKNLRRPEKKMTYYKKRFMKGLIQ